MGIKNRRQFKKALRSPKVEAVILPVVREGKIDSLLGRIACFVSGEHVPATIERKDGSEAFVCVSCKDGSEAFVCVSCWEVFDVE